MTDKEVMQIALEALEYAQAIVQRQLTTKTKQEYSIDLMDKAIEALHQTLAQSEQEPVGFNGLTESEAEQTMSVKGLSTEQEPVAWVNAKPLATMHMDPRLNRVQWEMTLTCSQTHDGQIPLYTAPPKRERKWPNHETYCGTCGACTYKPWVGLTDEEIQKVVYDMGTIGDLSHDEFDICHAVMAKLKEKNNG